MENASGGLSGTGIKPSLMKAIAIDIQEEEAKKLSRGISRTAENAGIISQVRSEWSASLSEVEETVSHSNGHNGILDTNDCTFTLPDLSAQSEEFRKFLESELIDTSMSISLQDSSRLNWWTCLGEGCEKLWPLSTTGDGNCLLHAASLGMWGFHDRLLTLRKAMHSFLTVGSSRHALWRRWRWQIARSNVQAGLDLYLNEDEWRHEWDNVLKLASSQPRTSGSSTPNFGDETDGKGSGSGTGGPTNGSKTYESLEEIHVLALAHVLKRPIIVIADKVLKDVNGEALAPITFGGIYLPLEIEASECSRSPLVLAYDAAHFSALVAMKKKNEHSTDPPAVLPLVDVDRELLPIQFEVDPGEVCVWNRDELNEAVVQRSALTHEDRLALLNQFLDLVDIHCPTPSKSTSNRSKSKSGSLSRHHDTTDGGWISDGEFNGHRSHQNHHGKQPKQFQSVAKQFGSLGRSVSRKIKKNLIENFTTSKHAPPLSDTRLNNGQWECPDFILCARLHTEKHHPCLEQMITNYLNSARQRFEQHQAEKQRQTLVSQRRKQHTLAEMALQEGPSPCINPNCTMYGTALTSYMCTACYAKQLEQEEDRANNLKSTQSKPNSANHISQAYGAGKSVFYTSSDSTSYAEAAQIPARKPPSGQNGTLFLSNSTFYNDVARRKDSDPVTFEKLDGVLKQLTPTEPASQVFDLSGRRETDAGKMSPRSPEPLTRSLPPEPKENKFLDYLESQPSTATVAIAISKAIERPPGFSFAGETTAKMETAALEKLPIPEKPAVPPRPANLSARTFNSQNLPCPVNVANPPNPPVPAPRSSSHYATVRKPCKTVGCTQFGQTEFNGLCSECFRTRQTATMTRDSILERMRAAQMQ